MSERGSPIPQPRRDGRAEHTGSLAKSEQRRAVRATLLQDLREEEAAKAAIVFRLQARKACRNPRKVFPRRRHSTLRQSDHEADKVEVASTGGSGRSQAYLRAGSRPLGRPMHQQSEKVARCI